MAKQRIIHFEYFRGVTILLVVASHSYGTWNINSILEISFVNMITGATALFVFISGFFFHFTFYNNFDYWKFLDSKFKNVFMPYLVLSTLSMIAMIAVYGSVKHVLTVSDNWPNQNIFAYIFNILTGYTWVSYWYVPFIMVMFLLSPAFIWYIKRTKWHQIFIAVLMFISSMVVHRATMNLNPIHNVLYFSGFYLLGILYSEHRIEANRLISKYTLHLIVASVVAAILMAKLGQTGNATKDYPWVWSGLDLIVPVKVIHIAALIRFCIWLERFRIGWLVFLANISFGIFFIHPLFISPLRRSDLMSHFVGAPGALSIFLIAVGGSILVVILTRSIVGSKSRRLIGC